MRFNPLNNFISPVTGRILCDPNYVLVGNEQGIAIPMIKIPPGNLPALSFKKFWVGDSNNTASECLVDIPVCYAASTEDLGGVYDNGIDGVGATLTIEVSSEEEPSGVFILDNFVVPINNLVLIKNQDLSYQNGVYVLNSFIPPEFTHAILIRTTFYDASYKIRAGDSVTVRYGDVNGLSTWVQTQNVTTVGTDSISYIGPMGPVGPKGPKGDKGDQEEGGGGGGNSFLDSLLGGFAGGAAIGIAQLVPNGDPLVTVKKTTVAVTPAMFFNTSINMTGQRIQNIAPSPLGDFDAVNAKWVWDLLNDNVEIKWGN